MSAICRLDIAYRLHRPGKGKTKVADMISRFPGLARVRVNVNAACCGGHNLPIVLVSRNHRHVMTLDLNTISAP